MGAHGGRDGASCCDALQLTVPRCYWGKEKEEGVGVPPGSELVIGPTGPPPSVLTQRSQRIGARAHLHPHLACCFSRLAASRFLLLASAAAAAAAAVPSVRLLSFDGERHQSDMDGVVRCCCCANAVAPAADALVCFVSAHYSWQTPPGAGTLETKVKTDFSKGGGRRASVYG
eukprot:COSAG06_NODE_259_length_18912_cov_53.912614_15_plen_173_part_00